MIKTILLEVSIPKTISIDYILIHITNFMRGRHILIKWITKLQYLSKTTNMRICPVHKVVDKSLNFILIILLIGVPQVIML